MGLLYAVFSMFFTIFYPKQITDVICFGRHRDQVFIKTRKAYYLIRAFWTFVFGMLCLMMGSAAGVDSTFDNILNYCEISFGNSTYLQIRNTDRNDYHISKKNNTLEELEPIIKQIIAENHSLTNYYELDGVEVKFNTKEEAYIIKNQEVLAKVEIDKSLFLETLDFQWDKDSLNHIKKGG
ncbi:MAG: hypothetical protein PHY47_08635 [Lachnospiraceae bacterium]|nr:hypothetical protein [Lachnospiraceae bacterium]